MRFRRYSSGSVVAQRGGAGEIVLKIHPPGDLLRTIDGVPRVAIAQKQVVDVAAIFSCVAENLDRHSCVELGVEVEE